MNSSASLSSLPLLAGAGLPEFQDINPDQVTQGIPLLLEKFKTNLARRFAAKQQQAILDLCASEARLAATPVNEFVDLFVV